MGGVGNLYCNRNWGKGFGYSGDDAQTSFFVNRPANHDFNLLSNVLDKFDTWRANAHE